MDKNGVNVILVNDDSVDRQLKKTAKKLHKKYLQNNLNSQLIIYPEARHELINETNKQQVYNDIINFYNN